MSHTGGRTRREILADAAKVAAAASVTGLAGCFPSVGGHWAPVCVDPDAGANANVPIPRPVTPTVVEVLNQDSVNASSIIQPDVVAEMFDAGLTALASRPRSSTPPCRRQTPALWKVLQTPRARMAALRTADAGTWAWAATLTIPGGFCYPNTALACASAQGQLPQSMVVTSPALVHAIVLACATSWGGSAKIVVWDRRLDELNRHGKYSADDSGWCPTSWDPE